MREPIFFLLLCTATALIGLFPTLSLFVFREQIKLVTDSSMATTMVFGLMAAVLCASHTVSREMKNGTVLLLLSKPVPRTNFILAKISGITAALTLFVIICNTASLISMRVACDQFQLDLTTLYIYYGLIGFASFFGAVRNYFARRSFSSAAIAAMFVLLLAFATVLYFIPSKGSEESPSYRNLIYAFMLILFAVWIMGAITVTLSTRLDMVANLTVCTAIFLTGLVSDYFFGRQAEKELVSMASVLYALIPNWQFFWLADALANKRNIPLEYILWSAVYVFIYISFCSSIAILLFRNKEIAGNLR